MKNTPGVPYFTDSDKDVYTSRDEVEWREVDYLLLPDGQYEYQLTLPQPLANWDVFSEWERARIHSMAKELRSSDILYDVGTEQGWCNIIYARFVNPANMVLIEPTTQFWPNIRAIWEKNYPLDKPLAFYHGLIDEVTNDDRTTFSSWPDVSVGPLIDRNKYTYIFENNSCVPSITLDDLAAGIGFPPTAISIDVEGAEGHVLRGAEGLIREHHPKIWCSVHPDMMARDFGESDQDLHEYMRGLGYRAEHLATDHEQHYFYHV